MTVAALLLLFLAAAALLEWASRRPASRCARSFQVFLPEIAICRVYGGGGNRTRVTSEPETCAMQEETESGADDDPPLAACNTFRGGDVKAALYATHPDTGGNADDFRRTMRAKELLA